jgi:hypothetical protein
MPRPTCSSTITSSTVHPFETVVFYHCFFVSKPICYLQ